MTPRRKTTQPRARKETVAEAKGGQGKGQGVPPVDTPRLPSPTRLPSPIPDPPAPPPTVAFCDNHPTTPAVLVTDFPWAAPQKFCRPCVPAQYLYLL